LIGSVLCGAANLFRRSFGSSNATCWCRLIQTVRLALASEPRMTHILHVVDLLQVGGAHKS
jgi:hypothetical protein